MKNLMLVLSLATLALAVEAAPTTSRRSRRSSAESEEGSDPRAAKVNLEQFPKLGQAACLPAPTVSGASLIGKCYNKPRKWIVLEAKYATFAKWQDQLTFTWHVLLETKSATEKDREEQAKIAPYSYFTTSVTYANIPMGNHAASVVLPPSYLERFGEPKAVGLVIVNKAGDVLGGDCDSQIRGIKPHTKFWEDTDIMDRKGRDDKPLIERRQGLKDRSKTIWGLVNPNDYEVVSEN